MPFFSWQGIGLDGELRLGKSYASSKLLLEKLLLKNDIGLIKANIINLTNKKFTKYDINFNGKLIFFRELLVLLSSGLNLARALDFLSTYFANSKLQEFTLLISYNINRGLSFGDSLEKYKNIFSALDISLIRAGEAANNLNKSLEYLVNYLEQKNKIRQKVRSALITPVITLFLFILISLFIFIFIIPVFANIFDSMGQKLSSLTLYILSISNFLNSSKFLYLSLILFLLILIILIGLKYSIKLRFIKDKLKLNVFLFSKITLYLNLNLFWQTVNILLSGGVSLPEALSISANSLDNLVLKRKLSKLSSLISLGFDLNYVSLENKDIFSPEIRAIISAGSESGKLVTMSEKLADIYSNNLKNLLKIILSSIQPVLVIILGLLIALLILAIYLPLFELPNIINLSY